SLLVCRCGQRLHHHLVIARGKPYRYYMCFDRWKKLARPPSAEKEPCMAPRIRADGEAGIEARAWDLIEALVKDPKLLAPAIDAERAARAAEADPREAKKKERTLLRRLAANQ